MRLLFLNDNRAHPNWGAEATPSAIDALFEEKIPEGKRVWLSWDWLRSQHRRLRRPLPDLTYEPRKLRHGRWMLNRFSRPRNFFPRVADDLDRFADEWLAGEGGPMAERFLEELEGSDVLVYNGENSLYRNTLEGTRALFLLWLSKTRVGKTTCIVNHTAHLTQVRPMMTAMVRKVYPVLDLVTCREEASWELLQGMGIEEAELVPDVVYWLEEMEEARRRVNGWLEENGLKAGRYVCMSASGLPVSRPRGDWNGAYTSLVEDVQQRTGLRAVLVAKDPPCLFLAESARRTGALFFGPEHQFTELWPLFRQAAALVTGHFHYAIIASIGGCPFVPLSANNHKMVGLNKMLRWEPEEPFDVTDLFTCGDGVVDRLRELLHHREALSKHLLDRSADLREQVGTLPAKVLAAMGERG
ncbi:MAG: polysaccharide pyruvyl transferase family protein [Calditrichaeota bacterium]|nr:polysaccharide pyruvyl transferase family protein [Calditrichota bacterium]